MKIGFKLTLMMIVLSLVVVGAVGITLLTQASSSISSLSYNRTVATIQDYGGEVELFLTNYWGITENLADVLKQYESISAQDRRSFINTVLRGKIEKHANIVGIYSIWEPDALEGNDQAYIGTPGTTETGLFSPFWYREGTGLAMVPISTDEFLTSDYYLLPRRHGRTVILEPYIHDAGVITTIVTPIFAPGTNRMVGIVGLDLSIDRIQQMAQSHKPFEGSLTVLFSNSGIIVSHFVHDRLGRHMSETERDMAGRYYDDLVRAIRDGQPITFTNYIREAGAEFMIVATPIDVGDTPWSYAIGVPIRTVRAYAARMQFITIIISIVILALVIPISIILSRTITKPIIKVANTLQDISEGEGDLTRTITVKSKDEIGNLAHYFNMTLEKIRVLVKTIKGEAEVLSDIGTELASNMNETAAAINQITANIQSTKGQAINQSASVTETNATMEQITININKLNEHVERQTDSVSQSSSAIEEMLANVQSVNQTLGKNMENVNALKAASEVGRSGLSEVAEDIKVIAHESEGLLEINSVMENIASQTNLLSMNAAIEAAHAGEAGKGFAVVAEEIRKLAENSSEQSKTISSVLKKIKSSIDKITTSTDNVLEKFETITSDIKVVADQGANIRNAMEEQSHGSKQILEAIGSLNDITRHVKSGSMEMLEGSKEVIQESKNLERVTQEITGSMNEMASGADQINTAVTRVNDLSVKNQENIGNLMREVSRFKIE